MVTKSTQKTTKKAAPKKEPVVQKTPVATSEGTQKKATPTYKGLAILLVVFLYVELAALGYIYYTYDVSFYPKQTTAQLLKAKRARQQHVRKKMVQRRHHVAQKQAGRPHSQKMKAAPQKVVKQAPAKRVPAQKAFTEKDMPKTTLKAPTCPPPVPRKVAFNEAEYAPYAVKGNAKIAGNLCLTLADGSEKCFENVDIFINPVTSYSDEWYTRGWAGREYLATADARALPFNKIVKTGPNGAYAFTDLAPGSYYVGTTVCLPPAKDAKTCQYTRWATKVSMKRLVKPTLKKVFP